MSSLDRDFRWYWFGQTLSFAGTQVSAVAMPLVATLSLHASVAGVSAVATAAFLPNLLLPVAVGHWLEGRPLRPLMIASDAVRALAVVSVPLAAATDALGMGLLLTVAFVVGAASVVSDVAAFAYVPRLVDREALPEANRALQGSATIAQVGGPGLGGLLAQAVGPAGALAADAVSYVASALGIRAARSAEDLVVSKRPGRVFEGVRLLVRNAYLRALSAHASLYNAAAQILTVNLVIWTVRERGVPSGLYGAILSAGGVGAFAGTMLALRLARRFGYGRAFCLALALSTGVPLLTATLPFRGVTLGVALAGIQLVAGVGLGAANVMSTTLRQVAIPADHLARTTGGYRLLIYGSIPVGAALGGLIGSAYGARTGVAVGTAGLVISALPMVAGSIRRLRDPSDVAAGLAPSPT